jgi:catechol 2,3-dioxygenase-like lactoylglutathione lyase family enzyme
VAFARGHGHAIELIQYRGPADRNTMVARPCDVGFAHVALDVDNIEAAIAMAARYGFKPMAPPVTVDLGPNAGARVAYLRDHEGLSFEFIQKPPA